MTKRQKAIIYSHNNSRLYNLEDCYKNYSQAKWNGYVHEKCLCAERNGTNFKIISYNHQMFTIGFYYTLGLKVYFHYASNKTSMDFLVERKKWSNIYK